MNSTDVLDDYLEELLGDAVPAAQVAVAAQEDADGVAEAIRAEFAQAADAAAPAFDSPTAPGAPAALALLDELMNDPALGPAVTPTATAPAFDSPTAPGAPAALALLDELMNDPALGPVMAPAAAPAFDSPTAPGAPAALALLDELMNDPALGPVAATAKGDDARPSWDDVPPETLHDAPAAAPPVARAAPAAPTPAPITRAMPTPPAAPIARPAAPAAFADAAAGRPTSWQELQAQARNPASSPRGDRRASERTSRWLRLRCGPQAYALELLKVQEVVLPVPLLPLRGTASAMLGIMNLRGQVVPVMDLGVHLGAGPAREDANTRIVVLEENGETMGLRVSAVEDVANLTDSQIEPPDTARICQISNDLFRGVARVTAQPMILLDATQLLN
ncbi:MAG: chemotaxis protein CheW [Stenotrophomonas sp.]|uniref:chemotaxis protein CheW n=1 Tax=Stenotrophomonas sp. TaxID=69392 RepID=UPI003D6CEEF9